MNPTFTISIDTEKRKASAAGLVAVGEKVDVVVTGLDATQIPEWEQDNDEGFTGPSLRFRIVAPDGKDLVRFPLAEGDAWTIGAEGELTAERRAWQATIVFLPGESHGQRSLVGYSPKGHKESDTTEAS